MKFFMIDPESKHADKSRVKKFFVSVIIAILCVVLLSLISSCEKDDMSNNDLADVPSCIEESSKNKEVNCTVLDQPVCGCDGVTYTNACEARYNYGVTSWTKGACEMDSSCMEQVVDSIDCYLEYEPVCGCNGITYANECVANKLGITEYTSGTCGTTALTICKSEEVTIGIRFQSERHYVWTPDQDCDNCSEIVIEPSRDVEYTLSVYDSEYDFVNSYNPVNSYDFKIRVEDCSK
tara:strand:+ start:8877 stop:9584 length:708 start_codon:yes stop_codon:yes gene_type:complete